MAITTTVVVALPLLRLLLLAVTCVCVQGGALGLRGPAALARHLGFLRVGLPLPIVLGVALLQLGLEVHPADFFGTGTEDGLALALRQGHGALLVSLVDELALKRVQHARVARRRVVIAV